MFLISTSRSSLIFLNFQQYFALRNSTVLQLHKFFLTSCDEYFVDRKPIKLTTSYLLYTWTFMNIRLTPTQTSTVRQQNMSCFQPNIRTCFSVTCTRLDATNGKLSWSWQQQLDFFKEQTASILHGDAAAVIMMTMMMIRMDGYWGWCWWWQWHNMMIMITCWWWNGTVLKKLFCWYLHQ